MKVFYHSDLDGRCSGAILWKVMHERVFGKNSLSKTPMEAKMDFIGLCQKVVDYMGEKL